MNALMMALFSPQKIEAFDESTVMQKIWMGHCW